MVFTQGNQNTVGGWLCCVKAREEGVGKNLLGEVTSGMNHTGWLEVGRSSYKEKGLWPRVG